MDDLMRDIRAYAAARGIQPGVVLQYAIGAGGGTWKRWEAGRGGCTLRNALRLRDWMAAHPVEGAPDSEAA